MKSSLAVLVASLVYPLAVQAGEVQDTELLSGRRTQVTPIDGSFEDNTKGYCSSGLTGKEAQRRVYVTDVLAFSYVDNYDNFVTPSGNVTEYLDEFYQTTLSYLPSDLGAEIKDSISIKDAMLAVMFAQIEGPERSIQPNCISALYAAQQQAVLDFFRLAGFGDSFSIPQNSMHLLDEKMEAKLADYSSGDEPVHDTDVNIRLAMSHYLHALETNTDEFDRFFKSFAAFYEAFGEFNLFSDWIYVVGSWEELSLTPMSLVAKYAALYLTGGSQLKAPFLAQDSANRARLTRLYNNAVTICNAPTEMPSMAPSAGIFTFNRFLPVVAIVDETLDSAAGIEAAYQTFRTLYPDRFFCLIQFRTFDSDDIKVPVEFVFDEKAKYLQVSADNGNSFYQSDWYDLCEIKAFEENPYVAKVPIYLGVRERFVSSSLKYFEDQVIAKIGNTTRAASNSLMNYFTPFNTDF